MIESTPSEIVAAYLISQSSLGIGRPGTRPLPSWPVTKGALPVDGALPPSVQGDDWVSIVDLPPYLEGKYMNCDNQSTPDGESVVKPIVQILVRARDYDSASLQIRKISCVLSPVSRAAVTCLGGEEVLFHACCIEQQPCFFYQEEKNRRQVFVMKAKLSISTKG